MREIKVRAPAGMGQHVAQLALDRGIRAVAIHKAYDPAIEQEIEEIKIKTSTPRARSVIDSLLQAPFYVPDAFSISSHDIRSFWSNDDVAALTRPFCMPISDVYEDLWQNS